MPDRRIAGDGSLLLSFDVVVARARALSSPDDRAVGGQVPVTWKGPEAKAPSVTEGDTVTVVGSVHRRFYRRGGATMSRTDLRAERIIRGAGRRAARAISEAFTTSTHS